PSALAALATLSHAQTGPGGDASTGTSPHLPTSSAVVRSTQFWSGAGSVTDHGGDVRPFAKSTLQEFRAQLIVHQQTGAIFQQSLGVAKRRGVWKKGHPQHERQQMKLALDTTHILGRGAVKDTYNLLADGIVQVLHALAKLGPFEVLDLAEELDCTRYVQGSSLKGQADVDWTDPRARQRFLAEIVTDATRLPALVRETRAGLVD